MCVLHFDFRDDLMNTKVAFKEFMKNFWYYFIVLFYSFKKHFICMITHLKQNWYVFNDIQLACCTLTCFYFFKFQIRFKERNNKSLNEGIKKLEVFHKLLNSALPLIWRNEFVAAKTSTQFVCRVLICSTYISGGDQFKEKSFNGK